MVSFAADLGTSSDASAASAVHEKPSSTSSGLVMARTLLVAGTFTTVL
jgi:hypothetical protein